MISTEHLCLQPRLHNVSLPRTFQHVWRGNRKKAGSEGKKKWHNTGECCPLTHCEFIKRWTAQFATRFLKRGAKEWIMKFVKLLMKTNCLNLENNGSENISNIFFFFIEISFLSAGHFFCCCCCSCWRKVQPRGWKRSCTSKDATLWAPCIQLWDVSPGNIMDVVKLLSPLSIVRFSYNSPASPTAHPLLWCLKS